MPLHDLLFWDGGSGISSGGGECPGLGTNLFSSEPALCKILDFDVLNTEIGKYSAYCVKQFA